MLWHVYYVIVYLFFTFLCRIDFRIRLHLTNRNESSSRPTVRTRRPGRVLGSGRGQYTPLLIYGSNFFFLHFHKHNFV